MDSLRSLFGLSVKKDQIKIVRSNSDVVKKSKPVSSLFKRKNKSSTFRENSKSNKIICERTDKPIKITIIPTMIETIITNQITIIWNQGENQVYENIQFADFIIFLKSKNWETVPIA